LLNLPRTIDIINLIVDITGVNINQINGGVR